MSPRAPLLALFPLLCALARPLAAAPALHADVVVFVPAYEGSQLFDPGAAADPARAPCVWGSLDAIRDADLYLSLRLPNRLEARPMLAAGPLDVYGAFVSALTHGRDDAPGFHPYTRGADFFVFAYDWRQEIATVAAPELGRALEHYARVHEAKSGVPAAQTRFVLVAHSMGGLVARTLLSQDPQWGPRMKALYLVGTPSLGSVKAIHTLVVGPGGLKENALGFPASLLNLLPNHVDANLTKLVAITRPSAYELLPVEDPRWECVEASGRRTRVGPDQILTLGPWLPYWPSADLERRLFIDGWMQRRAQLWHRTLDPDEWTFCQDPGFGQLQRILAQVKEWRLRMGTLAYTDLLLTRPGEPSRLRLVVGTGLKTPTGIITEGGHDDTRARYTYAPDTDGDETVTGASVLDDLHPNPANVKLLDRVPHGRLMIDRQFLAYFCGELAREPLVDTAPMADTVPPKPARTAPARLSAGGTLP